MKRHKKEFHRHRSEMNEKILGCGFKDYQKFFALDNKAYLAGALPAKMKERDPGGRASHGRDQNWKGSWNENQEN